MLRDILKCNYYATPMNLGRATHNRGLRSEREYYGHNDLFSLLLPKGRPTRMLALPKTYKAAAETMSDTRDVLAPASRSVPKDKPASLNNAYNTAGGFLPKSLAQGIRN